MDQQQRNRLDQDNIEDRNIDTSRSERRQAVAEEDNSRIEAGSGANDTGSRPSDSTRDNAFSSGTTSETIGGREDAATGSHAEGQYPKQDQGGATGGQMAQQNQGGAAQGQVGKPGDQPE
jgi:hypothetical protein